MRHKDILLNKSDQMFVKDLLKITLKLGEKSGLFTFKVASFDGADELRPGKGV